MEVLTVISILVFLLALLVPGMSAAREQARSILCQNNLRQWGAATQYYRDDNGDGSGHF
jgi:type II secretory pathway pseudopilin PulG